MHQVRVPARNYQPDERRRKIFFLQIVGSKMRFEMIYADDRLIQYPSQRLGSHFTDEQITDESRPRGTGNDVDHPVRCWF